MCCDMDGNSKRGVHIRNTCDSNPILLPLSPSTRLDEIENKITASQSGDRRNGIHERYSRMRFGGVCFTSNLLIHIVSVKGFDRERFKFTPSSLTSWDLCTVIIVHTGLKRSVSLLQHPTEESCKELHGCPFILSRDRGFSFKMLKLVVRFEVDDRFRSIRYGSTLEQ